MKKEAEMADRVAAEQADLLSVDRSMPSPTSSISVSAMREMSDFRDFSD